MPLSYNTGAGSDHIFKVRDYDNPLYLVDTQQITVTSGSLDVVYPTATGISAIVGEPFYVWWDSNYIYHGSSGGKVTVSIYDGTGYSVIKDTINNTGTTNWL